MFVFLTAYWTVHYIAPCRLRLCVCQILY